MQTEIDIKAQLQHTYEWMAAISRMQNALWPGLDFSNAL
jgi:hypothetical protein